MNQPAEPVRVDLDARSYNIEIGTGNLGEIGRILAARCAPQARHAVVITDTNVEKRYAKQVIESIAAAGPKTDLAVVPAGEPSKSIAWAEVLWKQLLKTGADRKSIVVALGGGVVGDLAGFVAATFGRGLRFIQVPTTLLAQVDSSVGGKVGINLPAAKNMVGAFLQPVSVLIDTQVLKTLRHREYRAGLAEVVKYGVIKDADFFSYLEQNIQGLNDRDDAVLTHVVRRCCRLKADIVEKDEFEAGELAVLNYGHTFCHALETVMGYGNLLHGEAVSIGMLCASRLAEGCKQVDADFTARQAALLQALGLPIDVPDVDHDRIIAAMSYDKKASHGWPRFVLPTRMGHVDLVDDVEPDAVRAALTAW